MKIKLNPLTIVDIPSEVGIVCAYVVGVHVGVSNNWETHVLSLGLMYWVYRLTKQAVYKLIFGLMIRYGDDPESWPSFKLNMFKKR